MNQVKMNFTNDFEGELIGGKGHIGIGKGENVLMPYELLMGALGSCLYATFLDVVKKMRLEYEGCHIDIEWVKREEVPTTLKEARLQVVLKGCDRTKDKKYEHAFQLATEYCSIFVTLSHVAEIQWDISFI